MKRDLHIWRFGQLIPNKYGCKKIVLHGLWNDLSYILPGEVPKYWARLPEEPDFCYSFNWRVMSHKFLILVMAVGKPDNSKICIDLPSIAANWKIEN